MFRLKKSLANTTPSIEYFEGTEGEVFTYGEALVIKDGRLSQCAPTEKPTFISLGDVSCEDGAYLIPVMRVFNFYIFDCPFDEDTSSLKIGDKVTLDPDCDGVTANTSGGVAEIVEIEDGYVSVIF